MAEADDKDNKRSAFKLQSLLFPSRLRVWAETKEAGEVQQEKQTQAASLSSPMGMRVCKEAPVDAYSYPDW